MRLDVTLGEQLRKELVSLDGEGRKREVGEARKQE
jgi:hypothetical protein